MSKLSLMLATLIAITIMPVTQTLADEVSPVGKWQTATGEAHYEISFCGEGSSLCAKLTWLRSDARTAENLRYLGRYVVQGAARTAANRWRGAVSYGGDVFGGSVTLVNDERLQLKGCVGVFCQSLEFSRL